MHCETQKIMLHQFIKQLITSQLAVYIVRCVIGFLLGYWLMHRFPEYEPFWALLSIILVISPEGKDSRRLTGERVKSNLIGSSVGLLCHLIHPTTIFMLVAGIVFTSIICHLFKVMNMSRVAIVAFLIVMLQSHTLNENTAPLFRFATVAFGCFTGFAVTVFTSIIIQKLRNYYGLDPASSPDTK